MLLAGTRRTEHRHSLRTALLIGVPLVVLAFLVIAGGYVVATEGWHGRAAYFCRSCGRTRDTEEWGVWSVRFPRGGTVTFSSTTALREQVLGPCPHAWGLLREERRLLRRELLLGDTSVSEPGDPISHPLCWDGRFGDALAAGLRGLPDEGARRRALIVLGGADRDTARLTAFRLLQSD